MITEEEYQRNKRNAVLFDSAIQILGGMALGAALALMLAWGIK